MIDFKKYTQYSKPGPRYTSYPTALEFSDAFAYEHYLQKLEHLDANRALSLYIHLPFCRNACYFCGCSVVFTSKEEKMMRYIEYLEKELAILAQHVDTSKPVMQMHFGGGTPTFYDADALKRIITLIKKHFVNFTPNAELSCEIDPRHLSEAQMNVLHEEGFNRVSFGIQDFNEAVQQAVHRIQPFDISKQAVDLARRYNMHSVNIDLIYGLPFQSFESFKTTLNQALTLDADRFALFNYAHVPWLKKTMRKIDETTLPAPEEKLKIFQYAIEFFTSNGYKMVGMDHFAKPHDELFGAIEKGELHRNFQGYTTKGGTDLIGIGLTSIGNSTNYYAQHVKDMKQYEALIDAGKLPLERGVALNADDMIRNHLIMELMSNFKIDILRFEQEHGICFKDYFSNELSALEPFIAEGLVDYNGATIVCSQTGVLLVRNIAMLFDAYMHQYEGTKKSFSKTI